MKTLRNVIIFVLVIAVLVIIKIKFFPANTPQGMPQQQGKPIPVNVTACIVKPGKLDNKIYISGTLLSNEEVTLMPEVAGKISAINFKEGSAVKKGDLLVKINDDDLQAQLKKLQLQEKLASEKEARQKKLLAINGISQEEYDASLTQLNSLGADIEVLKAQIAKTQITAPFDGKVGLKNISEGSYVTPGTQIAAVQQINPMKLDFYVPEKYASLVKVNSKLTFTTEVGNEKHDAVVMAIEPKVDATTRTIQVRAKTENKNGNLFSGSFVRIEFSLEETENALMIPTESIIPILKGQKVFVSRGGKAEEVKVTTGLRNENKVQVLSGLASGDTVIATGIMQLKTGSLLNISSIKE
ncbi:MAG: Multidrug resistance protein MdtA [Bacteroidia bacterium]|nr:Multidrug resistance protein MdtA [Bacteroidia bacterium]